MCAGMTVVVEAVDGGVDVLVFKHTLSAVAERYDADAFAAHRDGGGKVVNLIIAQVGGHIMFQPGVEDAASVDAMHQAEGMVDV